MTACAKVRVYSQPVVQGATGPDPAANARHFLRTADANARWFKRRHLLFGAVSVIVPTLVTALAGHVPAWAIASLSALSAIVGGLSAFLRSQDGWLSARRTAQELASELLLWDCAAGPYRRDGGAASPPRPEDVLHMAEALDKVLQGDASRFRDSAAKMIPAAK